MTVRASVHTPDDGPAVRIDSVNETDARDGSDLIVRNSGSHTVFLGGPDVTAESGFPLAATTTLTDDIDLTDAESLWAICADGTSTTVNVLETGL